MRNPTRGIQVSVYLSRPEVDRLLRNADTLPGISKTPSKALRQLALRSAALRVALTPLPASTELLIEVAKALKVLQYRASLLLPRLQHAQHTLRRAHADLPNGSEHYDQIGAAVAGLEQEMYFLTNVLEQMPGAVEALAELAVAPVEPEPEPKPATLKRPHRYGRTPDFGFSDAPPA